VFSSSSGSRRLPYKIYFGTYDEGQTYYGLDKLNLLNSYGDPSGMRDWLSYRIMEEAGIDAPLTSYVWLTLNGEDIGLYLAVEEVGNSWMERTGHKDAKLYKPAAKASGINIEGEDDEKIIMEKSPLAQY